MALKRPKATKKLTFGEKLALRRAQKSFDVGTRKLKERRVASELLSAGLGQFDPKKSKSRRAVQARRFKEIRSTIKQRRGF